MKFISWNVNGFRAVLGKGFADIFEELDISRVDNDFLFSVTTEEIYDFFVYVSTERRNQAAAKSRKLSAIKAFYKYVCQKRRLLEKITFCLSKL